MKKNSKDRNSEQYKGKRVLILEGYARQCLALARGFRKNGCYVSVLCNSKLDLTYVSRMVHEKILGICDRERVKETEEQVRSLLQTGNYDIVVPCVDFSAALLSTNKEEFSKYAWVASNDLPVYEIAGDKEKTMAVCMEHGIPSPMTLLGINTLEDVAASGIVFPIVTKPRTGYGAIGFKKVDSMEELRLLFKDRENEIPLYVFQEYIPQTALQYECAMFVDSKNQVKTATVFSKNRWFPIEGGSSTLNITVDRPDIIESCTALLQQIQWRGPADIDLIDDPRDGKAKIMEINPRVSGSVKIVFESGADQAKQILEMALGQEVTPQLTYEVGRRLRCTQTDLLWFIKSPNRFKAEPSWFSIRKTKDHTFYWSDPLPWFAFSLSGLFKFKGEMKKRQ